MIALPCITSNAARGCQLSEFGASTTALKPSSSGSTFLPSLFNIIHLRSLFPSRPVSLSTGYLVSCSTTMSGRKGNLASRSLEYQAPETPNFLKALKAQVASSDRYSSSKSRPSDELDSFVTSTTSSSGKRKARDEDEDEDLDSEDEMRGAQVVVLKNGKHLSHEEALRLKTASKGQPEERVDEGKKKEQNIASTSSGAGARKRRGPIGGDGEEGKGLGEEASISDIIDSSDKSGRVSERTSGGKGTAKGGLEDVKELIRKERDARPPSSSKTDKEQKREDRRKEKNAAAKKLKAKSGKGLSFNFDDE